MKGKWKRMLSLLLAITILFTSEIIPGLSVKVQAEGSISKTGGSNYPYYCETCGFYYPTEEPHKQRTSCTVCNNTGNILCTLCNATGRLYCGQEGSYTEITTRGAEVPSGMMDSITHAPIGIKVPIYHDWRCNICNVAGSWTYWAYYGVPGIAGEDEGIRPTNTSAHNYSSMACTQCNGTGQYGGPCTSCNGLGSIDGSSFCSSNWKYRIVFDENGGTCDIKSGYYSGGCVLPSASKEGYRFLGWNTNPSSSTGNGSVFITASVTYYAIFEKLGTAVFIDMEGARDITANSISNRIYAPSIREGDYSGIGWAESTEADCDIVEKFQNGKTYYARYQTYASIEFNMGKDEKGKDYAGSSERPQGDYGNIIVDANAYTMTEWKSASSYLMPKEPKWKGHTFLGWSDGNSIYSPEEYVKLQKPVTVFTALWESKSNKILLDSMGATSSGDTFVEAVTEEDMPVITIPKKEYTIKFHKNAEDTDIVISNAILKNTYLFHGYYTDSNGSGIKYYNADGTSAKKWDKTEDITLYASWTNEGITLPTAERKGYLFQGWSASSNAETGMKAGTNYKAGEDTNLYAVWKKETYSIHYNLADGFLSTANPDSYDVDTSFTLNNPIRDGYTFLGWTGDNGTIPEKSVQITKGTIGNKSYTANWQAKTDTIYKVEIYQMDINGSYLTSPNEIKELTGTTDTNVIAADIAKKYNYPGFTYKNAKIGSAVVSEMKIAGEGNSILKLFYERKKYVFTLGTYSHVKTKGTTAAGSYYYGTVISLKAQPDSGYHWIKWQSSDISKIADNTNQNIVITMPTADITMTPIVEPNTDTPYQIIIHRETLNGDYLDSSTDIVINKKGTSDARINAEETAKIYNYEGFSYSYAKIQDSIAGNTRGVWMNIDGDGTAKLHLYYTRNQYQLTIGAYDKNKLTTDNTNTTLLYGEKIKLKASSLSGYKFSHWDSGNTDIQPDLKTANAAMTMAASDISMTPIAEEISYTVEFKANDTNSHTPENNVRAAVVPNAQEYDYNEEFSMPVCTREGFRFLGWSDSKNGSVLWPAGTKASRLTTVDKEIVKLYAQWEENKYSIQFHANDGAATAHNPLNNVQAEGSMSATVSYYYTDNILLPNSGFIREGFTFTGWSLVKDSNAVEYKSGDFVHNLSKINNSVIILYAVWTEKSYPITFEPGDSYCYGTENGISAKVSNSQAMAMARVYYTDDFTMPVCGYIRDGFTFLGWSRNKKASEKTYTDTSYQGELQPGDIISNPDLTKEHIYYPVWKENQYKIIYHSNDSKELSETKEISSKNIYYTEDFRLAKGGFNRTGFTLRGWSVEEGSNIVSYAKEEKVLKLTVNETIDLYAAWKENTYRISFKPNDDYCYGTNDGIAVKVSNPDAMDSLELKYTENSFFPECSYIRTGFTFLGWSRNKNDSLKTYEGDINTIKPGTPIYSFSGINDEEIVYYPVWKENQYSIHFDKNDENNAMEPANEPKAEGKTTDIENIYYTQEINLTRNKFTRTGFDYKGWSDMKSSNSCRYSDRENIRELSDKDGSTIVLYAAWSEYSYTVNFKPADKYCYDLENNVRVSNPEVMQPIVLKYTENWNVMTDYKRTGFTFLGYSDTNDNKQVSKEYKALFPAGENINRLSEKNHDELIIYTIWKENIYKVCFNSNDVNNAKNSNKEIKAEGITIEADRYYTEKFDLPKNNFKRTGFTFLGWSDKEGDNTVIWKDNETCQKLSSIDGDIVNLYTVWDANRLMITYESDGIINYQTAVYDQSYTIADETIMGFHNQEKTFLGWSIEKPEGYGTEADIDYKAGTKSHQCFGLADIKEKENLHLYAIWRENIYHVIFDTNGGEGTVSGINNIGYTEEIILPQSQSIKEGYTFKGWSYKAAGEVDFLANETVSRLPKHNQDGITVTLYAIWSVTPPKLIEQEKETDLRKEIKPNTPITISASAIGLDIHYQWYYMDKTQTSGTAIKNAEERSYTIPAEEVIEENDGRIYYCILENESGQIKSEPFTLYIYGTPSIPVISDSGVNEHGWSSKDISITLSESAIKGSKEQVGYLYSFDQVTWLEYKELIWKENTLPDGKTIYFCAYNKECPELMSQIIAYTVRKDDENPEVMEIIGSKVKDIQEENKIVNKLPIMEESINIIENSITTGNAVLLPIEDIISYPIAIYAKDHFSGIFSYAVTAETTSEKEWQESNTFEVNTGTYNAYVMDMAGNIARQEFTVYAGGYILLSETNGSYTDDNISYIIGEGEAAWDNHMNIDKNKITHIIIQDGITEIPDNFFEGFVNLKEVTIPDSVVKIGENAFCDVPENMVIHASKGSEGEKAAKKHHYTEYDINITDTAIHVHYHEKVCLPEEYKEEIENHEKTFVGWGTKPKEKEFEKGEEISGLSDEMNGILSIYPIYTDAYIDKDGKLHITGDDTKYLDDIILDKDNIKEIIVESGVTVLPNQIPESFQNLSELTLPESLDEIAGKLDNMPENSVIHAPEGSKAAEEAERLHNTKYTIKIEGINEEIQGHYYDKIKLPETAPEKDGYLFIGWGTKPEEKEFEPGEIVSGLTKKTDGIVVLYPIYEEYKQEEKEEQEEKNSFINNSFPINSNKIPNNTEIINEEENKKEEQKYDDWEESDIIKTPEKDKEQEADITKTPERDKEQEADITKTPEGDKEQESDSNDENGKEDIITMKTTFSSIVIKKGRQYKIKSLKGVTKWTIKNKKIAGLKKKKGSLILIGKKKGKTILIGKTKKHIYQYIIHVKKSNNNQIKLVTTEKEKSSQWILTKEESIIRKTSVNTAKGEIRLKLLKAGKNVKWKFLGKKILKENGNKINVVINADTKYILEAKYKGKLYQCSLYRG